MENKVCLKCKFLYETKKTITVPLDAGKAIVYDLARKFECRYNPPLTAGFPEVYEDFFCSKWEINNK